MSTPDLRHDIDALFDHLEQHEDLRPGDEKEWLFLLSSDDAGRLEAIGHALEDDFNVGFLDNTLISDDGEETDGPPTLGIVAYGALDRDEVKELHARFRALAEDEGVAYEGVSCYDPDDDDPALDWLDLDQAVERLGDFAEAGLEPDAEVIYVFAIDAESVPAAEAIAGAFTERGYTRLEIAVTDEEEAAALIIHCPGRNDPAELTERYRDVESLAADSGAQLLGVQFFGDDGEEE